MSTGVLITLAILAVAAVAIVALVLAPPVLQSSGSGLRRRFGPEYDRTVEQRDGDTKAAHKELSERLRRYGNLSMRPLPEEERVQYVAQWAGVQEQFVDSPAASVAEADRLLGRLIRDRGFAADAYDEQIDALSVHHARHLSGYRRLHAVASRAGDGRADTEEMREALVGARDLFEAMVVAHPKEKRERLRTRRTWRLQHRRDGGAPAAPGPRDQDGPQGRRRFHLPWTGPTRSA
ncbi:hypothetical protein [Streptomyces sp. NPDC047108]|uniref:hypothetical protein n=1 Tax=Streptomyces sp. NPDC047108 TaxID=3155025 RepID=UPI00340C73C5